jgi:DNA-binding transcriptional MerR regulator
MSYSVGELARLVGVSVRALHHYDEIGLLTPSQRTAAGYRRYGEAELTRLRQILVYRELGFDLARIKRILDDSAVDPEEQLRQQRAELHEQVGRLERSLRRVESMIEPGTGDDGGNARARWSTLRLTVLPVAVLGVSMGIVNVSTGMREHGASLEAMSAGLAEAIVTTAVLLLVAFPLVSLCRSFGARA